MFTIEINMVKALHDKFSKWATPIWVCFVCAKVHLERIYEKIKYIKFAC
jgi:hypothetical protein